MMGAHWAKRHRIADEQKKSIKLALLSKELVNATKWHVTLSRIYNSYGHEMDEDDNLRSAFKHIKDAVADFINPGLAPGQADGLGNIVWSYHQERLKGKQSFVQVDIEAVE